MHLSRFLAAATLASGAALGAAVPAPAPVAISEDEIVLYGRGRYQVMKRADFDELNGATPPKPTHLDDTLRARDPAAAAPSLPADTVGRRWATQTIFVPLPHERFLGWDVQVSAVLQGPATVSVTEGYEIKSTLEVTTTGLLSLVKTFVKNKLGIDYDKQAWTTTQTNIFSALVPEGKYGALVSNPWTNRESGHIFKGVIGSEGEWVYYQGDSFEAKSSGGLDWVDGVIGICTGDSLPLKRCIGDGTL